LLTTETEAQSLLSTRLKEANAAFVAARKGDSTGKAREKALQDLEEGYKKYEEIGSNCDVGRKFYNDLARLVGEWRDGTRRFGRERREEAVALEAYVSDFLHPLLSITLFHFFVPSANCPTAN
jgi:programmed cell death 6-interacting protein